MKKQTIVCLLGLFLFVTHGVSAAEQKTAWYMEVDRLNSDDSLAITVMQGIANREKPSLFIFTGDRHWVTTFKRDRVRHSQETLDKYRNCDDAWKDYLEREHGYRFKPLESVEDLVRSMGDRIKGTVLYDASESFHYVLATALASAYDLVPVTDKVLTKYPILNTLPVKENIVNKYDNLLEAHREIWKRTQDRHTKEAVYSIGAEHHIYGLDMAVAQRMFVYRLGCDKKKTPDEAALVKEIISSLDPLSPAWGWGEPSESILRDLISEAGGFVMCSCIPNTSFFWKLKPLRQNPFNRTVKMADFSQSKLQDKYYISFMVNEGDTIKSAGALMAYGMWLEPQRGDIPINWGVCPWLYDHFPAMMEYYYLTGSRNDSFFPACAGYGYFTQELTPYLDKFARKEIAVNRKAGMIAGAGWGGDKLDNLEPGLRNRWYDSRKMLGYVNETGKKAYLQFTPENRPVVGMHWNLFYWYHRFGKISEEEIYQKAVEQIEQIAAEHEPPFFIPVYGGMPNWFTRLQELLDGDKFEIILMDEMMHLAKKAGQIQVTEDHLSLPADTNELASQLYVRNMTDKSYQGVVTVSLPNGWNCRPTRWQYPQLAAQTGNALQEFKIIAPKNCAVGIYKIAFSDSETRMSDTLVVRVAGEKE